MLIDARGTTRYFSLTETECTELISVFSKFKLITEARTTYGKYLDTEAKPVLLIHKYDKALLAVLVTDKLTWLHCPKRIVSALNDMEIEVQLGKGALSALTRHTTLFKRLKFHKCI